MLRSVAITNAYNCTIIGTWTWDVVQNRLFADPTLSVLFGMSEEEGASGLPVEAYINAIHENDRAGLARTIQAAMNTGSPIRHIYRVTCFYGQGRWVHAAGRFFREVNSNLVICAGHVVDVTGQMARNETFQDICTHLDLAHSGASRLRMPFLAHLIGMALLEANDAAKDVPQARLN